MYPVSYHPCAVPLDLFPPHPLPIFTMATQGMAAAGQMSIAQLLHPSSAPIPAHLLPPPHLLPQPGLMPPGLLPGFLSPGLLPPGLLPPGLMPPGLLPPGMMAPGMMPPGLMQPGLMAPGLLPPGLMPQGLLPSGGTLPLAGLANIPHHQRVAPQQLLAAAAALQATGGGGSLPLPGLLLPPGGVQYVDDTVNKRMKRKQSNRYKNNGQWHSHFLHIACPECCPGCMCPQSYAG